MLFYCVYRISVLWLKEFWLQNQMQAHTHMCTHKYIHVHVQQGMHAYAHMCAHTCRDTHMYTQTHRHT